MLTRFIVLHYVYRERNHACRFLSKKTSIVADFHEEGEQRKKLIHAIAVCDSLLTGKCYLI